MLKSGEKGLIGPGSNDYGRYTPDDEELVNKILKSVKKMRYDKEVSKTVVLHHLKQLKAQMGKLKKYEGTWKNYHQGIQECMDAIDKKIVKINKQ